MGLPITHALPTPDLTGAVRARERFPHEFHTGRRRRCRSEEHTSELQSRSDLVCRLLLEKKKASDQIAHLEAAIAPQEGLRATVGDPVVDNAVSVLRGQLRALRSGGQADTPLPAPELGSDL